MVACYARFAELQRKQLMSDFEDLLVYEFCFPGAITGETELDCPYCGKTLTVSVNDPMGEESYQCCQCAGTFEANWGEGVVRYQQRE
jgi:DNA-directed RNA polymerase subunit RPC12/RpoP